MARPPYEALDHKGLPFLRPARKIDELPSLQDRLQALAEATAAVAAATRLPAVKNIPFGAPVFTAFAGLNHPRAQQHAECALLLTKGCDLPLDYCQSFR